MSRRSALYAVVVLVGLSGCSSGSHQAGPAPGPTASVSHPSSRAVQRFEAYTAATNDLYRRHDSTLAQAQAVYDRFDAPAALRTDLEAFEEGYLRQGLRIPSPATVVGTDVTRLTDDEVNVNACVDFTRYKTTGPGKTMASPPGPSRSTEGVGMTWIKGDWYVEGEGLEGQGCAAVHSDSHH